VSFVALILFVYKPSRKLQFCVNYHKLNAMTYKDYYLLLLLKETLAYLGKAKIFTKLNIC